MIDNLLRYLDLQSENRQLTVMPRNKDRKPVALPVIPQYITLVLGITLQPYWVAFQENHNWDFKGLTSWLIFALITAVTIFPIVYKKTFDPSSSLFVQLCTIFSAGVGWQSLIAIAIHKSSTNH
jgi:membrane protein YdbS with pleckstrin-like domain